MAENHIASFLCVASGSPSPDVTWYAAKRRVTAKHSHYTLVALGGAGSVLRIGTAVARRDNGTFECRAENGVGAAASAAATLEVYSDGRGKNRGPVPQNFPKSIPKFLIKLTFKSVKYSR